MSSFILRDVPAVLWRSVKARSESDHVPLRSVFLQLLLMYATGQVPLSRVSPAMVDMIGSLDELNGASDTAFSPLDVSTVLMDEDDVESLLRSLTRLVDGVEKIHSAIVNHTDRQVHDG